MRHDLFIPHPRKLSGGSTETSDTKPHSDCPLNTEAEFKDSTDHRWPRPKDGLFPFSAVGRLGREARAQREDWAGLPLVHPGSWPRPGPRPAAPGWGRGGGCVRNDRAAPALSRRHSVVRGQGRLWVTDVSGGPGVHPACILTATGASHLPEGGRWPERCQLRPCRPLGWGVSRLGSGGGGGCVWGRLGPGTGDPGLGASSGLAPPAGSPWPVPVMWFQVHAGLGHPQGALRKATHLVGHRVSPKPAGFRCAAPASPPRGGPSGAGCCPGGPYPGIR